MDPAKNLSVSARGSKNDGKTVATKKNTLARRRPRLMTPGGMWAGARSRKSRREPRHRQTRGRVSGDRTILSCQYRPYGMRGTDFGVVFGKKAEANAIFFKRSIIVNREQKPGSTLGSPIRNAPGASHVPRGIHDQPRPDEKLKMTAGGQRWGAFHSPGSSVAHTNSLKTQSIHCLRPAQKAPRLAGEGSGGKALPAGSAVCAGPSSIHRVPSVGDPWDQTQKKNGGETKPHGLGADETRVNKITEFFRARHFGRESTHVTENQTLPLAQNLRNEDSNVGNGVGFAAP